MPRASTRRPAATAGCAAASVVNVSADDLTGLLVKPESALKQHEAAEGGRRGWCR